jgi:membrane-anchored protein YejM (alkaline phosphatase superfamily)
VEDTTFVTKKLHILQIFITLGYTCIVDIQPILVQNTYIVTYPLNARLLVQNTYIVTYPLNARLLVQQHPNTHMPITYPNTKYGYNTHDVRTWVMDVP